MKMLITVTRTDRRETVFEVEADSEEEGIDKAYQMASDYDFNLARSIHAYNAVGNVTITDP